MRIIAGDLKGRKLIAPEGEGTRPTTDRVRESVMSVIHSARGGFDGAVVLDAFAGSGALAIESLSRGARSAVLYERAPEAARAVAANLEKVGLDARRARLVRADVMERPPAFARPPFDLVFLDPPYAYAAAEVLGMVAGLADAGQLAAGAIVVYEHSLSSAKEAIAAADEAGLSVAQSKKYGDTVVDVLIAGQGDQARSEDE